MKADEVHFHIYTCVCVFAFFCFSLVNAAEAAAPVPMNRDVLCNRNKSLLLDVQKKIYVAIK